jgi:hypothetical protein
MPVTTDNATRIKLAETPPTHCASCFGQYPERRHVDFGAAWEGPAFAPDDSEVVGGKAVTIDELVVCEECLRAAATTLALTDEDTRRHVLELEAAAEELRERLFGATDYIAKLEAAAAARGTLEQRLTSGAA